MVVNGSEVVFAVLLCFWTLSTTWTPCVFVYERRSTNSWFG